MYPIHEQRTILSIFLVHWLLVFDNCEHLLFKNGEQINSINSYKNVYRKEIKILSYFVTKPFDIFFQELSYEHGYLAREVFFIYVNCPNDLIETDWELGGNWKVKFRLSSIHR